MCKYKHMHGETPTLICVLACESVGIKAVRLARGHPGRLKFGFSRGSSVKIGTIQRRLALPLRKDDTDKSRSVSIF